MPTQKPASDIISLNRDMTLNYVGFVGHIAYMSANEVGGKRLIKIDYRELIGQEK